MFEGLFVGVALLAFIAVAAFKFARKKYCKNNSPSHGKKKKVSRNQVRPGMIEVELQVTTAAGREDGNNPTYNNGGAFESIPHVGVFERSIGGQCFK